MATARNVCNIMWHRALKQGEDTNQTVQFPSCDLCRRVTACSVAKITVV